MRVCEDSARKVQICGTLLGTTLAATNWQCRSFVVPSLGGIKEWNGPRQDKQLELIAYSPEWREWLMAWGGEESQNWCCHCPHSLDNMISAFCRQIGDCRDCREERTLLDGHGQLAMPMYQIVCWAASCSSALALQSTDLCPSAAIPKAISDFVLAIL